MESVVGIIPSVTVKLLCFCKPMKFLNIGIKGILSELLADTNSEGTVGI